MNGKRVTIKDIANELGVSCAIINRALNNKSGVSAELRTKILDTAQRLGYRPNKLARSLARAPINLGVIIPTAWQSFYAFLERGIVSELDRLLDYNVEGTFYRVNNPYSATDYVDKIRSAINDGVDGIIITDYYHEGMEDVLAELAKSQIPTVTIGTLPSNDISPLASISIDSQRSGEMAAQMLFLPLKSDARVAVFIGSKSNAEHFQKAKSFEAAVKARGGCFMGCFETEDDAEIAEKIFRSLASELTPDGIYLATAGSDSVLDIIANEKYKTKVVATDITDAVRRNVSSESFVCTLYQDPEKQGRLAIRTLYDYLSEHTALSDAVILSPQIIIGTNLDSVK
ncbi:MAG: LacI family DNA-binding transcriptional regulator [Clostridia bacterium]|nr:LacI family DNA-binding transcriptional regulator [Clostridia bacterium]